MDDASRDGLVDILVNHARAARFDDWLDIFAANVAAVGLIQGLLPGMRTAGWGRIVQIATEADLSNVTVALAKHLSGTGITVNTVSTTSRHGGSVDVAEFVACVVSPRSSYINGANLYVDGGEREPF